MSFHVKLLVFLAALLVPCIVSAQGTFTAATCGQSDVNAIINGPTHVAANGDTIQIPAGSCTWNSSSGISVPSGIGITVIGLGCTPNSSASTFTAGTIGVVITDALTGGNLFSFTPTQGNATTRVSCIDFEPQTPRTGYGSPLVFNGTCTASGCPNIRMDNLKVPGTWAGIGIPADTFAIIHGVFGVADHNNIGGASGGGNGVNFANVAHAHWLGTGNYGDNSWASATNYGSANAFYMENNTLNGHAFFTDTDIVSTDGGGGRYVVRFNKGTDITGAGFAANHGTESPQRTRGGRLSEFYANQPSCSNTTNGCATGLSVRSGNWIHWGNAYARVGGASLNHLVNVVEYRSYNNFGPWGVCTGTGGNGPFDGNDGTTYYTGTYTGTTGSTTFVDANETWTTTIGGGNSAWAANAASAGTPYSVYNTTQGALGAEIATSNGTHNLTFNNNPGTFFGSGQTWTNGDSYVIVRSTFCLDASGRSGGTLLQDQTVSGNFSGTGTTATFTIGSGNLPSGYVNGAWAQMAGGNFGAIKQISNVTTTTFTYPSSATGTAAGTAAAPVLSTTGLQAPDAQTLDPNYEFDDSLTGGGLSFGLVGIGSSHMLANREYYAETLNQTAQTSSTSPFNGTSGTGHGTFLNRPSTCTQGVGYWATDRGSWNTSGQTIPSDGSSQGVLYICGASGWPASPSYTPYSYPHPLISGAPPTVATPTFSPAGGTYASAQTVTISTATASATICYTTDGTTPTANGAGTCTHGTAGTAGSSSASVSVSASGTVKAIGTESGFTDSSVGSATYTISAGTNTAPALMFTAIPLPAQPPIPTISSVKPTQSYVSAKGFSQDGATFIPSLSLTVTGTGFTPSSLCLVDGKSVPCACGSTSCVFTVPASAIPIPTTPTGHVLEVTNPAVATPVVN